MSDFLSLASFLASQVLNLIWRQQIFLIQTMIIDECYLVDEKLGLEHSGVVLAYFSFC